MKGKFESIRREGLPGGANEIKQFAKGVFSIEGYKRFSPDVNNPFNIIPSGDITMKDVDFPVHGVDNLGNSQIMHPGKDYKFPGSTVFETPLRDSDDYEEAELTDEEIAELRAQGHIVEEYQDGGGVSSLEGNLISKVIMERNRDKEFVKRAFNPEDYPNHIQYNNDGTTSTHRMAWGEDETGQAYMYPEIFNEANEAIAVPNQYADYISSQGYKNATGMNKKQTGGNIFELPKAQLGINNSLTPFTGSDLSYERQYVKENYGNPNKEVADKVVTYMKLIDEADKKQKAVSDQRKEEAYLEKYGQPSDNTRVVLPLMPKILSPAEEAQAKAYSEAKKKQQEDFEKRQWDKYEDASMLDAAVDRTKAFMVDPVGMTSRFIAGEQAYIPGMGEGLLNTDSPEYENYLKAVGYTPGEIEASDIQNMVNPMYWGASIGNNINKGDYGTAALESALTFAPFIPKGSGRVLASNARQGARMLADDVSRAGNKYRLKYSNPEAYNNLKLLESRYDDKFEKAISKQTDNALNFTNAWRQPERELNLQYRKYYDEALDLQDQARTDKFAVESDFTDELDRAKRLLNERTNEIVKTSTTFDEAGQKIKLAEEQYDEIVAGIEAKKIKNTAEYDDYFRESNDYLEETRRNIVETSADPDFKAKVEYLRNEGNPNIDMNLPEDVVKMKQYMDDNAMYLPEFPNTSVRTKPIKIDKSKGSLSLFDDPKFFKLPVEDQEYLLNNFDRIGGANTKNSSITFYEPPKLAATKEQIDKAVKDKLSQLTLSGRYDSKNIKRFYDEAYRDLEEQLLKDYEQNLRDYGETIVHESAHDSQKYANWIDRLVKYEEDFGYYTTKGDSPVAKQFQEVLKKPVKPQGSERYAAETWESAATELHSELDSFRFKLLKSYLDRGQIDSMEEGIKMLKQWEKNGNDDYYEFLIDLLKRHWAPNTSYNKKKAVLQLLPAAAVLGTVGGGLMNNKKIGGETELTKYQTKGEVKHRWDNPVLQRALKDSAKVAASPYLQSILKQKQEWEAANLPAVSSTSEIKMMPDNFQMNDTAGKYKNPKLYAAAPEAPASDLDNAITNRDFKSYSDILNPFKNPYMQEMLPDEEYYAPEKIAPIDSSKAIEKPQTKKAKSVETEDESSFLAEVVGSFAPYNYLPFVQKAADVYNLYDTWKTRQDAKTDDKAEVKTKSLKDLQTENKLLTETEGLTENAESITTTPYTLGDPFEIKSDRFDPYDRRIYRQEFVDLNQTQFGFRNRDEYQEIETEGGVVTSFNPFVSKKLLLQEEDFPANSTFIGLNTKGQFKTGTIDDFASNDIISRAYTNVVDDFVLNSDGGLKLEKRNSDNPNNPVPVVNVIEKTKDGKTIKKEGSLNVLTKNLKGGVNQYGPIQGGRVVLIGEDNSKILVSGSVQNIYEAFKEIKERTGKPVTIVTLDNGSYNMGLATKDNKLTSEDLKAYDKQNRSGGNFLYIKGKMPKEPEVNKDDFLMSMNETLRNIPDYSSKVSSPTAKAFKEDIIDQGYLYGMSTDKELKEKGYKGKGLGSDPYIDCSGAVCKVMKSKGVNLGNPLATNAEKIHNKTQPVPEKEWADGDIITFKTEGDKVDHIGFLVIDENTGEKYIAESARSFNEGKIVPFDQRIEYLSSVYPNMQFSIRRLDKKNTTSFATGGEYIEAELTPEEINWYLSQGYQIDELE